VALGAPFCAGTLQPVKKALLAAVLVAISTPAWSKDCGPLPTTFEGTAFTGDGDTIYGVGFKPGIRVWGMNAPELRDAQKEETVAGMQARARTADLLAEAGHKARCEPIEWDGYCRVVAVCTTATGVDITLDLLQHGLAYGFYLGRHPDKVDLALKYSMAEYEARKAKAGLWPYWMGQRPLVAERASQP
jgi:endonuclease YncB( thermonuclease family)